MSRSLPLALLGGLLFLVAGCADPGRVQSQLEFERLREHPATPDEDKTLPDFGTDSWSEEALRFLSGPPEPGAPA